jgi:hypothetical protein
MLCAGGIQLTSTRPSISTQTTKTSTTHHLQPDSKRLLIPTRGKSMKDKMTLLNIRICCVLMETQTTKACISVHLQLLVKFQQHNC